LCKPVYALHDIMYVNYVVIIKHSIANIKVKFDGEIAIYFLNLDTVKTTLTDPSYYLIHRTWQY